MRVEDAIGYVLEGRLGVEAAATVFLGLEESKRIPTAQLLRNIDSKVARIHTKADTNRERAVGLSAPKAIGAYDHNIGLAKSATHLKNLRSRIEKFEKWSQ